VFDDYLFKLSLYCENLELVFDAMDLLALAEVLLVAPWSGFVFHILKLVIFSNISFAKAFNTSNS
jgi:hypothetical protein